MANLFTTPLRVPPATTKVLVDYYDDAERQYFESAGAATLDSAPVEVACPTTDLCAYYLYYKLRPGVPGFSNHREIVRQWRQSLQEFDGIVEFANASLRLIRTEGTSTGTTERLGEAIGLSVVSSIHGLHQADWVRIPTSNTRRTFDFRHTYFASDGRRFLQIETKGAAVNDNRLKTSSVSNHKADIKAKKRAATAEEKASGVLFGTIAVLDDRPDTLARCWLVDPPPSMRGDPRRSQVLARLAYIADLVSFLGGNTNLAASLRTRLNALEALVDITPMDRVPLLTGTGKEYSMERYFSTRERNPWFGSKSVVADGPAGGQIYFAGEGKALFIGIQEDLILDIASQDLEAIRNYKFLSGTVFKTVDCMVPRGRFNDEFAPYISIPRGRRESRAPYVRFTLQGHLHYCQSGLILGVLPIPEDLFG